MRKRYYLSAAVFLLAVSVAVYSSADGKDGKKGKDDASAAVGALLSEEEALKPINIEPYIYDASGRRDPFMSPLASSRVAQGAMKSGRPKILHPLEKFKLSQMTLIGIVKYEKEYYASVVLPNGKSYTIKKGMAMGDVGGKVVGITEDTILVEELTLDVRGNVVRIPTEMKLKKEEEE
jgi:type IV pilus assembly protein PilP